ncbi:hypothetical protein D3C81_2099180 [compost metagenome]
MIRTPKNVLITEPRPPIKLVPPITTAAITCNSSPEPAFGSAASRREIWNNAAIPASNPIRLKTRIL